MMAQLNYTRTTSQVHEGEEEKFVKELSEEIEKRVKALPPLVD